MALVNYFISHIDMIEHYARIHFSLVLLAIVISLALWIPVGIIISLNDRWANIVISVANIIMCIPSLALFSFFITIPFLGLGAKSATTALVLYAMLPLVRNVYKGIKSVDSSIVEAAKGMGMNTFVVLWKVQIPLALPVIFAGIRVTVVMIVGMGTIATFIGVQSLGRLIQLGLARSDMQMITAGAILVAIISLILDFILGLVERKLVSPIVRITDKDDKVLAERGAQG